MIQPILIRVRAKGQGPIPTACTSRAPRCQTVTVEHASRSPVQHLVARRRQAADVLERQPLVLRRPDCLLQHHEALAVAAPRRLRISIANPAHRQAPAQNEGAKLQSCGTGTSSAAAEPTGWHDDDVTVQALPPW